MSRGVEAKYLPNGSGRDGFIFKDSRRYKSQGTLPPAVQFRKHEENAPPRMIFTLKNPKRLNLAYIPKAVQYHGDGSGKDNYVMYGIIMQKSVRGHGQPVRKQGEQVYEVLQYQGPRSD